MPGIKSNWFEMRLTKMLLKPEAVDSLCVGVSQKTAGVRDKWLAPISLAAIALLVWVAARAWISDDAAITVRCVDNLLHGYGLRWNVSERVQAFTHPLWALLLMLLMASRVPWFAALMSLSLIGTVLVIWSLVRTARSRPAALIAIVALLLSRAFVDFSTSGLENPLANLLSVALVARVRHEGSGGFAEIWRVSLVAALLAMTRLDFLLVALPVLSFVCLRASRSGLHIRKLAIALMLGMSPLVAWEVFSLIYYGALFPNTAYAKLNTGIDRSTYWGLGLNYFNYTLSHDPWTLLAAVLSLLGAIRYRTSAATLAFASGVVLYYLYVLDIGGDFMGGRFFVTPLVLSIALVSSKHARVPSASGRIVFTGVPALGVLCLFRPLEPLLPHPDGRGVLDERVHNAQTTSLEALFRAGLSGPDNTWLRLGAEYRNIAEATHAGEPGTPFLIEHAHAIGMLGVAAGPRVHIVDHLALTDPFLARLPAALDDEVQIGHFERMGRWSAPIPKTAPCPREYEVCRFWREYTVTLQTGACAFEDRALCRYWAALQTITRGSIFSAQRWRNIVLLNTGQLDWLIDRDHYRNAAGAYPSGAD